MPLKTLNDIVEYLQTPGENGISPMDRLRLDVAPLYDPMRPYLLATLLPEQTKTKNQYTESQIKYRTILANTGTSYSPAVRNPGGRIMGSFDVKFGNTNQKDDLDAQTYEAILELLQVAMAGGSGDMEAIAEMLRWFDTSITGPVMDLNEKQRADALVEGKVVRTGANGFSEDVFYPNPANHRVDVLGGTMGSPNGWYSATVDPFKAFFDARLTLSKAGYTPTGIYSAFEASYTFNTNAKVADRFAIPVITDGGFAKAERSVSMERVDAELRGNQLPGWTVYDRTFNYRDPANPESILSDRYLGKRTDENGDYWPVIVTANSGRNDMVELVAEKEILRMENTLGYFGIGRVLGQPNLGRIINTKPVDMHPGGLEAECIQEGLPVITEPEAFVVLKIYEPSA